MNRTGDWHGGGRKHKLRTKGGRTWRGREREEKQSKEEARSTLRSQEGEMDEERDG